MVFLRVFISITLLATSPMALCQSSITYTWGTSTGAQRLVTSDGSPIEIDEFSIELGSFLNGFIPTLENIEQWAGNWGIFDAVTTPDSDSSDGFIASGEQSRFVGSAGLTLGQTSDSEDSNNTDVFAPGSQAYVFIRNADIIEAGTEFLLYTSEEGVAWQFDSVQNSSISFSPVWFVSQADTVLFGGLNGEAGPGGFTDTSGDFVLRTHSVIPEPSVALLFVFAALSLLRRSRY